MDLMPDEIRKLLPVLYSNEEKEPEDVKVPLKLFDPCGRWTFYATEFDGEDALFGWCRSPISPSYDELGYASLKEISETKNSFGMSMERDIFWNPETKLKQIMNGELR
jgi:hypothetical protein